MDNAMSPTQTPTSGHSVVGLPPRLGTPVPGTTGGLPAVPGLSVLHNPMAQSLQSMGRGNDTMLVHMTPEEVGGLQQLAMASGGSLTINPHTGLPEAGWLGKLLPTILGAVLTPLTGGIINPLTASALIGAGTGIVKGDLKAGLMAGLQAYGGASLGSALGIDKIVPSVVGGGAKAAAGALPTVASGATNATSAISALPQAPDYARFASTKMLSAAPSATSAFQSTAPALINTGATTTAKTGLSGLYGRFADAARAGLPAGTPGIISKAAPALGLMGLMSGVSSAMQPKLPTYNPEENKSNYAGPYVPQRREFRMPTEEERQRIGTGEFQYFSPGNYLANPRPVSSLSEEERKYYGFAEGGSVDSADSGIYSTTAAPVYMQSGDVATYGGPTGPGLPSLPIATGTNAAPSLGGLEPYVAYYSTGPKGVASGLSEAALKASLWNVPGSGEVKFSNLGSTGAISPIFTAEPTAPKLPTTGTGGTGGTGGGDNTGTGTGTGGGTPTPTPTTPTVTPLTAAQQYLKDNPDVLTYWNGLTDAQRADIASTFGIPNTAEGFAGLHSTQRGAIEGRSWGGVQPTLTAEQQYLKNYPDVLTYWDNLTPAQRDDIATRYNIPNTALGWAGLHYQTSGQREGRVWGAGTTVPTSTPTPAPTPAPAPVEMDPQWGARQNISTNEQLAANTGYTGAFGSGGFQAWISQQPEEIKQIARETLAANNQAERIAFRRGGSINMGNGSFVLDARTVSEIGNGSSNAGKELLARMGGRPLDGPGDGVSDSIPARIGGTRKARVARDEVVMPPEVVNRIGKGDPKRGAEKLYKLMDRAHKARRNADRGQDTKLRKGLV